MQWPITDQNKKKKHHHHHHHHHQQQQRSVTLSYTQHKGCQKTTSREKVTSRGNPVQAVLRHTRSDVPRTAKHFQLYNKQVYSSALQSTFQTFGTQDSHKTFHSKTHKLSRPVTVQTSKYCHLMIIIYICECMKLSSQFSVSGNYLFTSFSVWHKMSKSTNIQFKDQPLNYSFSCRLSRAWKWQVIFPKLSRPQEP